MPINERSEYIHQLFEKISSIPTGNTIIHFDDCTFKNCDFTESAFTNCDFVNCTFETCNLSMIKFGHIGFDKVHFVDCKMLGVDFSNTKDFLFNIDFTNCILDFAAFMNKKNRKGSFKNCSLKGTDFSESDLTSAVFDKCDLSSAVFMRTILSGANFVSSHNFTIDPEKNRLKKAKFSSHGLAGLLENYGIQVVND